MDIDCQLNPLKGAKESARIEITQAYTAQYLDPICFDVGALISVEKSDQEYPGWFWCRIPSGKEGWVHRSFLAECSGVTTGIRAYNASELTVSSGEQGNLISELDGWAYIQLETGAKGWIPQTHFSAI